MQDSDRAAFRKFMIDAGLVFKTEINAEMVTAYFNALRFLSLDAVKRAFVTSVGTGTFFPKPVELRERAHTPEERPQWLDGEETYRCAECRDSGYTLRTSPQGTFSRPCGCRSGSELRSAWEAPSDQGRVFADSARKISSAVRRYEARKAGLGHDLP